MVELLEDAGILLTTDQIDRLWAYHNLLRKRNHDRDLTRIIAFRSMVIKHYIDCMLVGTMATLPSPLLDIGTGAGFPGIPLAIRDPRLELTLAEPRPRRVEFLEEARATAKLTNVQVFGHRVVSSSFTRPMKGVVTRALETMDKTLLRTSGCTVAGTRFFFMKGPSVDPELAMILDRFGDEFRLVEDRSYRLLDTEHERRLIVLERTRDPAGSTPDSADA
ncbi:MAG: 16S rRNA (guanine(527)-N(7))-methyltransferase RsmG [Deltaproteobacteria bacterium]|nr:16S rRNA (guanine(527)-N(7))-methyltransferase RsmG [Deltaproteobacteria bacterium]